MRCYIIAHSPARQNTLSRRGVLHEAGHRACPRNWHGRPWQLHTQARQCTRKCTASLLHLGVMSMQPWTKLATPRTMLLRRVPRNQPHRTKPTDVEPCDVRSFWPCFIVCRGVPFATVKEQNESADSAQASQRPWGTLHVGANEHIYVYMQQRQETMRDGVRVPLLGLGLGNY